MSWRDHVLLVGRLFASFIFVASGFAKLTAPVATKAYFVSVGIPLVEIAYPVAVVTELYGAWGLLLGWQTRSAAFVLMAYCVATALLVQADFRDMQKLIHFRKNFAMAGGYLAFMVVGPGFFSLDAWLLRRRDGVAGGA